MGALLYFGLITLLSGFVTSDKVFFCYYGTWAVYRAGNGTFAVENINPNLCTHIFYTFVGIDEEGYVISLDEDLDLPAGKDNFNKFNALKQNNTNLKTILAVGGWSEGSAKYSTMAGNSTLRQNFINSALELLIEYGFDGFDIDWEYPARRDTVLGDADIDNFSTLLKETKAAFEEYGFLLTAAVSAVEDAASLSYDIPEISKYLDYIGLMTYDLHGAWDSVTGHNAALHKGEADGDANRTSLYTVDVAVEYWLGAGCPPEKLVVGLPLYGRTFTLADASNNGVGANSTGAGISGPYTNESGTIAYNEFCYVLQTEEGWEVRNDSLALVPYAVQGVNWVSFDNTASLTTKVEYGIQNNLAGFLVWSIESDDFNAICSEVDFPLLRSITAAIKTSSSSASPSSNKILASLLVNTSD